ncbi:heme ABC exporter ATP-binding protein CcmA [Litorimonas sp.]|uniref:heme ABC exporter ATP-binding protein CcmA n=1 Tax=Litorimonas sp. TaxID=1892381 RepID=UPI003A856EFC
MTSFPDKTDMEPFEVKLKSISLRRGERVLFENLSLDLKAGDLLYVLGENGIGKTSLLLAMAGLLKPHRGKVNCPDATTPALSSSLMIRPDGASRGLTVLEDLKFMSNLSATSNDPNALLKKVGLSDLSQNRTETLSLGQRKRLSLAKLLLGQRPLWLLDEPFSALDSEGRALFAQEIARHLGRGGIAVIATHQPTEIPDRSAKTLLLKVAG